MLDSHQRSYSIEFGPQIHASIIVFPFELLHELIEARLRSFDLLLKQVGTVL
jgi:hypothetical protein